MLVYLCLTVVGEGDSGKMYPCDAHDERINMRIVERYFRTEENEDGHNAAIATLDDHVIYVAETVEEIDAMLADHLAKAAA